MTTDLRILLQAVDPAENLNGYSSAQAQAIVDRIVGDAAAYRAQRPRAHARVALSAGLAAAALVVGVVAVSDRFGPHGASDAARAVLVQAAAQAADPPARADQWWRIASTGVDRDGVARVQTTYVAVDGSRPSVIVQETYAAGLTGDRTSRSVWGMNLAPNQLPGTWQAPNAAFLASLPRDVPSLTERLRTDTAGHGQSPDGEVVVYIADVLRSGLVPADLRAALYAVLQTVPGIDVGRPQAVAGGRTGVVIAYHETLGATAPFTQELLIDPRTGDLLATREVHRDEHAPWGQLLERAVVDEIPPEVVSELVVSRCWVIGSDGVGCQDPRGEPNGLFPIPPVPRGTSVTVRLPG